MSFSLYLNLFIYEGFILIKRSLVIFTYSSFFAKKLKAHYCTLFSSVFLYEDMPCKSLMNPTKLSFPSECRIQSRRTTWTGIEGLRPSSCLKTKHQISTLIFLSEIY